MYTQCTNCQAIFSVNMREITVSEGLLRCGECDEVFDSSKNLSTTMQDPFVQIDIKDEAKLQKLSIENEKNISAHDNWQNNQKAVQINLRRSPTKTTKNNKQQDDSRKAKPFTTKGVENTRKSKKRIKSARPNKLTLTIASILLLLLISQVAYNYRHLFLNTLKYEPEKIQMLNHNVFAHPIEKNVLLISASIKNTANFDQAFPILEVRLTNSKAELVALRRFSPDEYLDNYSTQTLLKKDRATSIKFKIQDPGSEATRFQFNFL